MSHSTWVVNCADPPGPIVAPRSLNPRRRVNVAKKKKVRVAFKKNRQKRTRANDLTRRYHADDLTRAEPTSGEPL